jgi:hypothetical protein
MSDIQDDGADKPKWQSGRTWLRGFFMLVFGAFFWLGQTVLGMSALVQFFWLLFAGRRNEVLARFGASLALWMAEVARFQTCATEDKPFPWRDWPKAG